MELSRFRHVLAVSMAAWMIACDRSPSDPLPSDFTVDGAFKIDGDASDWQGVVPVLVDSSAGTDVIRSVRVTNDARAMYFLVEITFSRDYTVLVHIDADRNLGTGCPYVVKGTPTIAVEGTVIVTPTASPPLPKVRVDKTGYNGNPCNGAAIDQWTTAAGAGPYVEFAVPLDALRQLGMTVGFDFLLTSPAGTTGKATYLVR